MPLASLRNWFLFLSGVLGLAIGPMSPAFAQESSSAGQTAPATAESPAGILVAGPGEGLEAAISGASYRLGPGDGLTIGIWAPQPIRYELIVNLEGKLLVPGVGEIDVDALLLDDAREVIRRAVLQQFHGVKVTVSLTRLRKFQIHVLGQVLRPGTYLGTAVDRVSAAVGWAGGVLENASQRRIQVLSGDSVRAHADLFLFLRRGIAGSNPWLRDGDIISVPYSREVFTVQGAVSEPGDYEFLEGDRFSEALSYAGGFTRAAFRDTIEIARYLGPDRHPVRFFAINGGDLVPARPQDAPFAPAVIGRAMIRDDPQPGEATYEYPDFELRPDDIVFVRSIPEYRIKKLVEIRGEVLYPGLYAINEGETRLSDIIRRAGEITPEAFLSEASLIRQEAISLEDKEFERLKTIPAADMTKDEYEYYKLRSRETRGLMVVDFAALLVEGDSNQDLLLRRGDLIIIPTQRDFVSVLGMARAPGNVLYELQLRPKDYIARAGGFAEKADRGKTRVIRAIGGEWVSLKEVDRIEPGDTIWIPEKTDRDYWQLFKDVMMVTTQILTIYLIADRAAGN